MFSLVLIVSYSYDSGRVDFSEEKPMTWKTKRKGIDSDLIKFYVQGKGV
jgi:hypothetical protein